MTIDILLIVVGIALAILAGSLFTLAVVSHRCQVSKDQADWDNTHPRFIPRPNHEHQ